MKIVESHRDIYHTSIYNTKLNLVHTEKIRISNPIFESQNFGKRADDAKQRPTARDTHAPLQNPRTNIT
jgi:hypothetical protein